MSVNLLPFSVVCQLIEKHAPNNTQEGPRPVPGVSALSVVNGSFAPYVAAAIEKECAVIAALAPGDGRYLGLLTGAMKLAGLANADWAGRPDIHAPLLAAARENGSIDKHGEERIRALIDWALGHASPRPLPPPVPDVVTHPPTTSGTGRTNDSHDPYGARVSDDGRATEEEKRELKEFFPDAKDENGISIKPTMIEVAMLRRDNPRQGATHMVIGNGYSNEANRVLKQRAFYKFYRLKFREHQKNGGSVYRHDLRVPTTSEDDVELLKEELRDWGAIRKRFQRSGALYRCFSIQLEDAAYRVILSSTPAHDGQEPLADPLGEMLSVLKDIRPLSAPYPRRNAHHGPSDAWQPKQVKTGEWITVGTRPAHALLEMDQDTHDQAAAAANDVDTWKASAEELAGRSTETIVATRHWKASAAAPSDTLLKLWGSLGFDILPRAWEAVKGDAKITVGPPA